MSSDEASTSESPVCILQSRRFSAQLLQSVIAICISARGGFCGDLNEFTERDVLAAWKDREAVFRTFRFKCVERRLITKGEFYDPSNSAERELGPDPIPTESLNVQSTLIVLIDGDRMRYECVGPAFETDARGIVDRKTVSTYDGENSNVSRWMDPSGAVYPQGRILAEKYNYYVRDIAIMPLLLSLRTLHPGYSDPANRSYRVTGRRGVFNDRQCAILEYVRSSDRLEELWVDPERSYIPLRYMKIDDGKPALDYKLYYENMADVGWVPVRWECLWFSGNGDLYTSRQVDVLDRDINLQTVDADFKLEFPAGMWVRDVVTGKEFIQKEGGLRRDILPGDSLDYATLVATEGGVLTDAAVKVRRMGTWWITVGNLVLLGVLAVYLAVRRRHVR